MSTRAQAPSYMYAHMYTHKLIQRYTEDPVAQPKWASLKYPGKLWESK